MNSRKSFGKYLFSPRQEIFPRMKISLENCLHFHFSSNSHEKFLIQLIGVRFSLVEFIITANSALRQANRVLNSDENSSRHSHDPRCSSREEKNFSEASLMFSIFISLVWLFVLQIYCIIRFREIRKSSRKLFSKWNYTERFLCLLAAPKLFVAFAFTSFHRSRGEREFPSIK